MDEIPDGWGTRLHYRADLEQSGAELEGLSGYDIESSKGRVLSLQLHLRQASFHFRRAVEIFREAPKNVDPLQVRLTDAYIRDNNLIAGKPAPRRPCTLIRESNWKIEAIESLHRTIDALEDLHEGRAWSARETYLELLEKNESAGPERKSLWNLGLAVASLQLEDTAEFERRVDVAGLHASDPECRLLGRAQIAARIAHVHRHRGDHERFQEWMKSLGSLPCPKPTVLAMARRALILTRRSAALGRCVLG